MPCGVGSNIFRVVLVYVVDANFECQIVNVERKRSLLKQFYSFCTVKAGTKLQKRRLLLLSFSVSGPSDNSVHGKTGFSLESYYMPLGIPGFSANYIMHDGQASINLDESVMSFYPAIWSQQTSAETNHINHKGIGPGGNANVLTHFNETKQN